MMPDRVLRGVKPLFFDGDDLIVARGRRVSRMRIDGTSTPLFNFDASALDRALNAMPLFRRMWRSGVRVAASLGSKWLFCYGGALYRFEPTSGRPAREHAFDRGRGPLQLCVPEGVKGFDGTVYFGEYRSNHGRDPVHIYRRDDAGQWAQAYRFAAGEINHIHALVADPTRDCLWILAGDYDHSAAIFRAYEDFGRVERVAQGEQAYRACVAFPIESGLVYATDTQLEPNGIRLLEERDGRWQSRVLATTNGPCIYGCELADYYVFSTATEPAPDRRGPFSGLLETRPGPGIVNNASDIVLCRKSDFDCHVLASNPKDPYPYRLFQFGAITFPTGPNPGNRLYAYNVACRRNGQSTEVYDLAPTETDSG